MKNTLRLAVLYPILAVCVVGMIAAAPFYFLWLWLNDEISFSGAE
jgi:hypothetical protein